MKITVLFDRNDKHNLELVEHRLGYVIRDFEANGHRFHNYIFKDGERYISGISSTYDGYEITFMRSNRDE